MNLSSNPMYTYNFMIGLYGVWDPFESMLMKVWLLDSDRIQSS